MHMRIRFHCRDLVHFFSTHVLLDVLFLSALILYLPALDTHLQLSMLVKLIAQQFCNRMLE